MSFEDLADRVEGNLKTLSKLVKQLDDSGVSAGAKGIQLEATRVLADADQSMKAMAREVKATPSSKRRPMAEREAELAAALKAQRDGLSRAVAKRERDALLHKPDRAKQVEEAATDKLASAASRASSNTQKLREVQGVLSDTQDIGVGCVEVASRRPPHPAAHAAAHRRHLNPAPPPPPPPCPSASVA